MADPTDLEKIEKYWELTDQCVDDELKIEFFNLYPEAFEFETEYLDEAGISYSGQFKDKLLKDGGDKKETQAAMEDFWNALGRVNRKALPDGYKLEAFDCVLECSPAYEHLRDR